MRLLDDKDMKATQQILWVQGAATAGGGTVGAASDICVHTLCVLH
jgi:hypothetical protein